MTASNFDAGQILGSRENQEDSYDMVRDTGSGRPALVIVADGMGGHAAGDVASKTATRAFVRHFAGGGDGQSTPERLLAAVHAANDAILDRVDSDPALEGMGTTLVAVSLQTDGCYYASVGDSLLFAMGAGGLRRINADHSMRGILQEQVRRGELSAEHVDRHPQRNQLLSALGDEQLEMIDCPAAPIALGPGELLLIASDGIETLSQQEIAGIIVEKRGNPKASVDALLRAIEQRGNPRQDNCTIAIWAPIPARARARARRAPFNYRTIGIAAFALLLLATLSAFLIQSLPSYLMGAPSAKQPATAPRPADPPPAATAPQGDGSGEIGTDDVGLTEERLPGQDDDVVEEPFADEPRPHAVTAPTAAPAPERASSPPQRKKKPPPTTRAAPPAGNAAIDQPAPAPTPTGGNKRTAAEAPVEQRPAAPPQP
jgi:serine/threonine protein phosphatase PrpC